MSDKVRHIYKLADILEIRINMKNTNTIAVIWFILFIFSIYLSAVTNFPYAIYYFFVPPILLVFFFKLYFVLGFDKLKAKKDYEKHLKNQQEIEKRKELEKIEKQKEWDNKPEEEKQKIIADKKRIEKQIADKYWKDYKNRQKEKQKELKLLEERRLNEILREEQLAKIEIEKQKQLEIDRIANEKQIEENKILVLIEQKKKRENDQKEAIKRKILENERKKQLESEAIQELLDAGLIDNNHYTGKNIRESIPTDVKVAVWKRDKECCVNCFSNLNLEFDHIIPVSKGGANSIKNIQLLCRNCNRTKSNKIM